MTVFAWITSHLITPEKWLSALLPLIMEALASMLDAEAFIVTALNSRTEADWMPIF